MKQTIDELAGPATIVALLLSISAALLPKTLGWQLAAAGMSLAFLAAGFILYRRSGRRIPAESSGSPVETKIPRTVVAVLLVAAMVCLIAAVAIILLGGNRPEWRVIPGDPTTPASTVAAGPRISPSPTVAMATVAGVPIPPAPAILLTDAGCPGSTNTTTVHLEGDYSELNFRVAIDDSAGSDAHVQFVVVSEPSGANDSQVIGSGSGTSVSQPTADANQVVLKLTNLTHHSRGCSSARTKVILLDISGRS